MDTKDEQVDDIMERIRIRQIQSTGSKENDEAAPKTPGKFEAPTTSPTKVLGASARHNAASSDTASVNFRAAVPNDSSPLKQDTSTTSSQQTSARKSRFSALAEEQDAFECELKSYNKPKEAFMKGKSPRLSIGETRPSVLCTPAGVAALRSPNVAKTPPASASSSTTSAQNHVQNDVPTTTTGEEKRIHFARDMVNVKYLPNESTLMTSTICNDSTVLAGSADYISVTTSSLSCDDEGSLTASQQMLTTENTVLNSQSCANRDAILRARTNEVNMSVDEYGAHTFMRKKSTTNVDEDEKEADDTPVRIQSKLTSRDVGPTTSAMSPSIHAVVSSPKPFSRSGIDSSSSYSPVQFTPMSTSSPKTSTATHNIQLTTAISPFSRTTTPSSANVVSSSRFDFSQNAMATTPSWVKKDESNTSGFDETPHQTMSPAKSAALENARARTIKDQFEQKLKGNNGPIPQPRQLTISQGTPLGHAQPQQTVLFQKNDVAPATTPTFLAGVQTQWRGSHNTPVVQGTRADEPTAGSNVQGAGAGKLKNLKSRWEFSSATGTPIHPDASEDTLLAAAIRMKETAIPNRAIRNLGQKGHSGSSVTKQSNVRSTTASPVAKNLRYDEVRGQTPEHNDEMDPIDDEESGDEDEGGMEDASKIIDEAFDFMGGVSKLGTPSPYRPDVREGVAPIAQQENMSPRRRPVQVQVVEEAEEEEAESKEEERHSGGGRHRVESTSEVIEEEDVPIGDEDYEDAEDDEGETREETQIEREWSERKNESRLPYSVSFYRKIQRERVAGTPNAAISEALEPSAPSLTSSRVLKQLVEGVESSSADAPASSTGGRIFEEEHVTKERLKQAIKVEDEHISQSKRALLLCRDTVTFRGSREEIEMQRAMLIAVEKQRAYLAEYERLQRDGPRIFDGPRGDVSIQYLQVNISRDFLQAQIASTKKSSEIHFFVSVLKWGEQVEVSKLVSSDNGTNRKGILEFSTPLTLKGIPPDFKATVEIYGQRTRRENISHEEKYKLKGATLKNKSKNASMLVGGTVSGGRDATFSQYVDTSFHLLGSFTFDVKCPGKKIYQLCQPIHPLEGTVAMKIKKKAVDASDIRYKGFLSMYQRTREGLGSWTRYWCVLDGGEMKFWRHPEDEGNKNWLVLLDLATCIRSEGASTVSDICPYPNSFHIDVWVPKEEMNSSMAAAHNNTTLTRPQDIEQLRVMLAADMASDLKTWLSVINSSSRQLCTWRNPIV